MANKATTEALPLNLLQVTALRWASAAPQVPVATGVASSLPMRSGRLLKPLTPDTVATKARALSTWRVDFKFDAAFSPANTSPRTTLA